MGLFCQLTGHRARPMPTWNRGYYFSRCRRCGADLIRTAFGRWEEARGFRVVWSPGREMDPAKSQVMDYFPRPREMRAVAEPEGIGPKDAEQSWSRRHEGHKAPDPGILAVASAPAKSAGPDRNASPAAALAQPALADQATKPKTDPDEVPGNNAISQIERPAILSAGPSGITASSRPAVDFMEEEDASAWDSLVNGPARKRDERLDVDPGQIANGGLARQRAGATAKDVARAGRPE